MSELCLVSASGGLDSSTTLGLLKLAGYKNIIACHFDYGQRSNQAEKIAITNVCKQLDIPLKIFDVSGIYGTLGSESISMLLDKNADVVTGTDDEMKTVGAWVPMRNGLFLCLMAALAETEVMKHDYDTVYLLGGMLNLSESGCFVPNSDQMVTSGDNKQIDPLGVKIGDKLLSFNFKSKLIEPTTVKKIVHPVHETTYKIYLTFDEGLIHSKKVLYLSKEHPVYIKGKEWVEAQHLQVGDMCYTYRECASSQRAFHMSAASRKRLGELASIRFAGKPRSEETKKKISEANKKVIKDENWRKNISASLTGKMVGDKNPMYGHIRSNDTICWCGKLHKCPDGEKTSATMKEKWKDPEYRRAVMDNLYDKFLNNPDRFSEWIQKQSISSKARYEKYLSEHNGMHWNQTEEGRKKLSDAIKKALDEGKINPSNHFNKGPNKAEKTLIDLFESCNIDLRYVGDGQIWMTAEGRHMNPDFINIKNRKIVEYYGGIGFFHSLEEIEDRDKKFRSIGWDHLAIIEGELNDLEKVKNKVINFMMDVHNGWIIEKIEKIDSPVQMINYECEPNNNFFINKVLTHNSYVDNSEYFLMTQLESFKYSTLIGNRIKPLYGLSDIMKFEQFALINEFKDYLMDAYKYTISCDRAIVDDNGIARNCMHNGIPACGSGLLSYWASKMVGLDDTKIRNFYECNDDKYHAYIPGHMIKPEARKYDIHQIIDRIHFDKDHLQTLHDLIKG